MGRIVFETAITVGIIFGGLGSILFLPYYHFLTKGDWRKTGVGQHIMAFSFVMAMLYTSGLLGRIFPGAFAKDVIRAVLVVSCAVVVWWRIILFRKIQKESTAETVRVADRDRLDEREKEKDSLG